MNELMSSCFKFCFVVFLSLSLLLDAALLVRMNVFAHRRHRNHELCHVIACGATRSEAGVHFGKLRMGMRMMLWPRTSSTCSSAAAGCCCSIPASSPSSSSSSSSLSTSNLANTLRCINTFSAKCAKLHLKYNLCKY